MSREPVQIFEIDVPVCSLVYGQSPCTAALSAETPAKCYNMFNTCQDTPNYDRTSITLRFATSINGLLKSEQIYPTMSGTIDGSSLEINTGIVNERIGPLGRRETMTVPLSNFRDNDTQLDPYQDERVSGTALFNGVGHNPEERGTFWPRLLARWPFWKDAACRVLDGYVGEPLSAFATRNYIVHKIKGPNAIGDVQIEIKDVLDLVSNRRVVPSPSNGELPFDIDEEFLGSFTFTAATIGEEYSTSGRISIGNEIMTFTRVGDVMTITARGIDGTTPEDHSLNDTVQECYRVENGRLDLVIAEILTEYANVNPSFIPSATWADEVTTWLASVQLTRTIPKPVSVLDAVASLIQHGLFMWWDRENQTIGLRANRPLDIGETAPEFTDLTHFIEGTFTKDEIEDRRITDVLFFHGQIDPTGSATDSENYSTLLVASDNEASSKNQYGNRDFLTVYSPWLGSGSDGQARAIAFRLLYRFRNTPVRITAEMDIDEYDNVLPAAPVLITTRAVQAFDGSLDQRQYQVIKSQRKNNNRVNVTFESYQFVGKFGFITENNRPDYSNSTPEQLERGTYFVDGTTLQFPDGSAPYVLF